MHMRALAAIWVITGLWTLTFLVPIVEVPSDPEQVKQLLKRGQRQPSTGAPVDPSMRGDTVDEILHLRNPGCW